MGLLFSSPVMKQGLVALALLFLACGSLAQSCHYTDSTNGCEYDFSTLVITQGPPYYEFDDTDASTNATGSYEVNICAPVNGTTCVAGSGVCQTTEGNSFNCGNAGNDFAPLETATPGTCGGVVLNYIDGTFCPGPAVKRQSNINIRCNASVPDAVITSIRETAPCVYLIEMESAQACGTSVNISIPSPTPSSSQSPSPSASLSVLPSGNSTNSASPSASASLSASMSMSQSLVNSNDTTGSNDATGSNTTSTSNTTAGDNNSTSSGSGWIWWVVIGIAIVVVVAAIGAAGFVVYKKKQQSYDSIGYE